MIHDALIKTLDTLIPGIVPVAKSIKKLAIGGTMRSEDPYAIDPEYLKYLFSTNSPARPCPRF